MFHFLTLHRCLFCHREILQFRDVLFAGWLSIVWFTGVRSDRRERHCQACSPLCIEVSSTQRFPSFLISPLLSPRTTIHAAARFPSPSPQWNGPSFYRCLSLNPPPPRSSSYNERWKPTLAFQFLSCETEKVSTIELLCSVTFRFDFVLLQMSSSSEHNSEVVVSSHKFPSPTFSIPL